MKEILGYQRQSGPPGIRNVVASIHTVECSSFVSQQIAALDPRIHALGFPGCYRNEYAARLMTALGTHPNVGAVLLVSLGCEGTDAAAMAGPIRASGRPGEGLRIQGTGGTPPTTGGARSRVAGMRAKWDRTPRVPRALADRVVGTECGGSIQFGQHP